MAELLCVCRSEFIPTRGELCPLIEPPAQVPQHQSVQGRLSLDSSFTWCWSRLWGSHCQVMVGCRQDLLPFSDHPDVPSPLSLLLAPPLQDELPVDETRNPQHGYFLSSRSAWAGDQDQHGECSRLCPGWCLPAGAKHIAARACVQTHSQRWDQLIVQQ